MFNFSEVFGYHPMASIVPYSDHNEFEIEVYLK